MGAIPRKIGSLFGAMLMLVGVVGASVSADGASEAPRPKKGEQFQSCSGMLDCRLAAKPEPKARPSEATTAGRDSVVRWDRIPPRAPDARTGSAFMAEIRNLDLHEREVAILKEVLAGNIPQFLRSAVMIETRLGSHRALIAVMPDYLAIGSDDDFVRVPVNPKTAQAIADAFGGKVPTKKVVDEVYRQASVKLSPNAMTTAIDKTATFVAHNRRIEYQRRGKPLGALTAGHKKDVINARRAHRYPDRVCIYGWHTKRGKAIQPLSTVHDLHHVDYSHGLRLMLGRVWIDGEARSLEEVLKDPSLAGLLSHEGTLQATLPRPS